VPVYVLLVDNHPLTYVQNMSLPKGMYKVIAVIRFVPSFFLFQFMSLFGHLYKYSVPHLISSVVKQ
jgi:hypothetical protein